jgi:hypothetical protein
VARAAAFISQHRLGADAEAVQDLLQQERRGREREREEEERRGREREREREEEERRRRERDRRRRGGMFLHLRLFFPSVVVGK